MKQELPANCLFFSNLSICTAKLSVIIFETILNRPLVDHEESYRKILEIIELVSDNDSKCYSYPYTVAFVTGLWHEYIQYDIEDNPSLFY
jgi:hypothetical protein